MDVVIRDTKTIAEFKAKKAIMEARAADCYAAHRAAFENWTDGDPVKACIHGTGRLSWSMLLVAGGTTGRPAPERSSGTDSLWMCLHPRNGGVFFYYQSMVYLLRPRSWSMVRVCIRSSIS
jgi:hypothetical protein